MDYFSSNEQLQIIKNDLKMFFEILFISQCIATPLWWPKNFTIHNKI